MRRSRKKDEDKDEKEGSNYLVRALFCFIFVSIISTIWPSSIYPFKMYGLWETNGDAFIWLGAGTPAILWGVTITLLLWLWHGPEKTTAKEDGALFLAGAAVSTWAGVVEEICFRWLIFLNALWGAKFFSMILCGFPEWLYMHLVGPIANFFSLGLMADYIYHPASWAVGSAMLTANAAFRDGHKYQGILGILNSWYIGLFLFWIMFQYGLPAAILVHLVYDFLIFTSVSLALTLRRILH